MHRNAPDGTRTRQIRAPHHLAYRQRASRQKGGACRDKGGTPAEPEPHGRGYPPVTVLTKALELATMERPGSMMRVRPREETRSRTVSIRSLGVGSTSPLRDRRDTRVVHGDVNTIANTVAATPVSRWPAGSEVQRNQPGPWRSAESGSHVSGMRSLALLALATLPHERDECM